MQLENALLTIDALKQEREAEEGRMKDKMRYDGIAKTIYAFKNAAESERYVTLLGLMHSLIISLG